MTEYRAALIKGLKNIEMGSMTLPKLGPGEALVQIRRASLCPTDLKKYFYLDEQSARALGKSRGLILGHEAAGVVVDLGPGSTKVTVGTRVAIDPVLPCGRCDYCERGDFPLCRNLRGIGFSAGNIQDALDLFGQGIGGAFADYVKIPSKNLYPLPDGMDFDTGVLMEPLADVLNSLEAAGPQAEETAVVFGLGAMGLMHVRVMHAWGVQRIVGVDPLAERRAKAQEFGATQVIDPEQEDPVEALRGATRGLGPELAFICAGGRAQVSCTDQALHVVRKRGRVLLYASALPPAEVAVDINQIHYGMTTLTGTVGFYQRHAEQALQLLADGAVVASSIRKPAVTLQELPDAFEMSNRPGVIKVGIDISDE
jgi:threonine dehydrogenase-like Zn-dependent dehydrogenase